MRRPRAYGSSCSQAILVYLHFVAIHSFADKNRPKITTHVWLCPKFLVLIMHLLHFVVFKNNAAWAVFCQRGALGTNLLASPLHIASCDQTTPQTVD